MSRRLDVDSPRVIYSEESLEFSADKINNNDVICEDEDLNKFVEDLFIEMIDGDLVTVEILCDSDLIMAVVIFSGTLNEPLRTILFFSSSSLCKIML
ncbi:hypothetical protein QYM36_013283 [Artemia franciscana]|uniref:Uncharacterized protein n=1 Tax=Artemia franciscana TaxID=6661 RepID=A0AA88KYL0_ARTSF|nr:hypothetical protein QYM36_013283 [Artemia franciscana]